MLPPFWRFNQLEVRRPCCPNIVRDPIPSQERVEPMDTSLRALMAKCPGDAFWVRFAASLNPIAGPMRDRRGVTAAEYAILAVAVVIVVGIAAVQLLDPTKGAYVYL